MSLKLRLNLIITLLLALILLIGVVLMIRNARDDVRAEVESTTVLALHLLDAEILYYTTDYDWIKSGSFKDATGNKTSIFRLQSLDNVRHLRIEFFDALGRLKDSNSAPLNTHEEVTPLWFVRAVDMVAPIMQPTHRQVAINGRVLGELVITPDPSYEIAEIWHDTLGLLILVAVFFVAVNAMIYWAVGRALRPVDAVMTALAELEKGNLQARLPNFSLRELTGISAKFNTMAQTLQSSIQNNHRLTQQIISLQEDERKNLARDLHDEIGQHLTAIHVDASAILNAKQLESVRESASAIDEVARQMMDIVRDMLQRLRPGVLDELGLDAALRDLIDHWRQRNHHIKTNVNITGSLEKVDETTSITIYRIVQECLTNISRHAEASRVDIKLESDTTQITLIVNDDGRGFDTDKSPVGFGLAGMRERVEGLGGVFNLTSGQGMGVIIAVILPLSSKVVS
jgi:two-component system sensor histidine kinase UhpB